MKHGSLGMSARCLPNQQVSPGSGSGRTSADTGKACRWELLQQLHVLLVAAACGSDGSQSCLWLSRRALLISSHV